MTAKKKTARETSVAREITPDQASEFDALVTRVLQVDPKTLPPVPPMPKKAAAKKSGKSTTRRHTN